MRITQRTMLDSFLCPITRSPMQNPVACADGNVYDKDAIQGWFDRGNSTSPLSNAVLPHLGLLPVPAFKSAIAEFGAWRKASDTEKNDAMLENALLRSRTDALEKEKLKLDKERAGMAITQRELANEYKDLAALRIQVQMEKANLSMERKLEEKTMEDLEVQKLVGG